MAAKRNRFASDLSRWSARTDARIVIWMSDYGILLLRVSLGLVFLWFGALKWFEDLSPASDLATRTLALLTFGTIGPETLLHVLAAWECAIGLGLVFKAFLRMTLLLLFVHLLGTFLPLVMFPRETFAHFPYAPTLEGQYIVKNLVLVSAGFVIGATHRRRGARASLPT